LSEGIEVTQRTKHDAFHFRSKFGQQAYCVAELRRGEEAAEVANKLRDLAAQVKARSK
jgi:hypothetical protein